MTTANTRGCRLNVVYLPSIAWVVELLADHLSLTPHERLNAILGLRLELELLLLVMLEVGLLMMLVIAADHAAIAGELRAGAG